MYVLTASAAAQFTEKRSRFLAFAEPVRTEEDVKNCVARLRKEYFDARHVCYAYVLGDDGERARGVDDGEPSGTAGRPILNQLQTAELTYTFLAVVRYFGGVKLGTGPLGVAYKTASQSALDEARSMDALRPLVVERSFFVVAPFAETNLVERTARSVNARISDRTYEASGVCFTISVPREELNTARAAFERLYTLRVLND